MNTIKIDSRLLFILVRDARLDGYRHVVEYLAKTYNAHLLEEDDVWMLAFKDDNYYTLFALTYSSYI